MLDRFLYSLLGACLVVLAAVAASPWLGGP